MKRVKYIILVALFAMSVVESRAQFYSVRTNALGWFTGSPNVGLGITVNRNVSFDFTLMGNPIKIPKFSTQFIMAQQGMRFWFLESNIGSFVGFHFTEAFYDVGTSQLMFNGFTAGLGVSYGCSWLLAKRWNIGVEIGGSVMYMKDTQYNRVPSYASDQEVKRAWRIGFLPTKFEVSVVYLF